MNVYQEGERRAIHEVRSQMADLVKIAEATPVPVWLQDMDRETEDALAKMQTVPFYTAIKSGDIDPEEMKRLHQQVGAALVFPFPDYLDALIRRTEPENPVNIFARASEPEEKLHVYWWQKQAERWGISAEELNEENFELSLPSRAMRDHLTLLSHTATIPEAVAGVNYSIESVAGKLTSGLAPYILPDMNSQNGAWLKIHAKADYKHAMVARYCLITGVGEDIDLQRRVADVAQETHQLSYELYKDSYRAA